MSSALRFWILVTFAAGLLIQASPAVYAAASLTPLGDLFSPDLAGRFEEVLAERPAATAVTPTGWWIVAGTLALSAALVARGVRHLRT